MYSGNFLTHRGQWRGFCVTLCLLFLDASEQGGAYNRGEDGMIEGLLTCRRRADTQWRWVCRRWEQSMSGRTQPQRTSAETDTATTTTTTAEYH